MGEPEPVPMGSIRPTDRTDRSEHSERSSERSEALSDHCAQCSSVNMKADSAYGKRMLQVEDAAIGVCHMSCHTEF